MEASGISVKAPSLSPAIVGRAIDNAKVKGPLRWALIITVLAALFDFFDAATISYALPGIGEDFHLGTVELGLVGSAGTIGMAVGAYLWGWIADKRGRLFALILGILIFSVFNGITAVVFSLGLLLGVRFLAGTGMGGSSPVIATTVAEFSPKNDRGKMVASFVAAAPVGALIAAAAGFLIVPTLGWRWLFILGAIPILFILLLRRFVPESPRWLVAHGRFADAQRALNRVGIDDQAIEIARQEILFEQPNEMPKVQAQAHTRIGDLFAPGLRIRTVHLWLVWFLQQVGAIGIIVWLPTFLTTNYKIEFSRVLLYMIGIQVCMAIGSLSSLLFADRIDRKVMTLVGMWGAGLTAILMSRLQGELAIVAGAAFFMLISQWSYAGMNLLATETYPLQIRALGVSSASGLGRVGSAVGPTLVGFVLTLGNITYLWVLVAGSFIIPALLTIWMAKETRGSVLE